MPIISPCERLPSPGNFELKSVFKPPSDMANKRGIFSINIALRPRDQELNIALFFISHPFTFTVLRTLYPFCKHARREE